MWEKNEKTLELDPQRHWKSMQCLKKQITERIENINKKHEIWQTAKASLW